VDKTQYSVTRGTFDAYKIYVKDIPSQKNLHVDFFLDRIQF